MKKRYFFLFLFFSITYPLFSQVPFFQQYYLLRKNDPVHVNTIFQDNTGFMWFGTNRGLFQFDGKNYRRYTQADSLADNEVTAIAQDSAGRLWVGHKNGKLSFQHGDFFQEFKPSEGPAAETVSDILFDKNGVLWFSTLNDGLYYYKSHRLYRIDEAEGMPDLFVYDIIEDEQGRIWAGTDGGVAICALYRQEVSVQVLNQKNGLPDNIVKKIRLDINKNAWLATEDAGIIKYDIKNKTFTSIVKGDWTYGGITDFVLSGNQTWISLVKHGFVIHDHRSNEFKNYDAGSGYNLGMATTMYRDGQGNIWAGTRTGVLRTSGDIVEYISNPNPQGTRFVMAVVVDRAGDTWFSTNDGLFKRSRSRSGEYTLQKPLANTAFKNFTAISLFVDDAGFVWIGLYGEGVLRLNPETGRIRHLDKELRNGNVLGITGKKNTIWLATLGGAERILVDGEKLTFQNFNQQNGLSSDFIYQVFIDSKNRVWFATDGKGIDLLDESGLHPAKGVENKVVYGFSEDITHTVWANVQHDGVYFFKEDKFVPAIAGEKLQFCNNNIAAIATDKNGNTVFMHDKGIDVFNPRIKTIRHLDDQAGLQSRRANLNAVAIGKSGDLLFGTDDGIVICNAPKEASQTIPRAFIESVSINGQRKQAHPEMEMSYDEDNLIFHFLSFYYENPDGVTFFYKMDNYDADWIPTGDNTATYSQLPPGEYTFRLRAVSSTATSGVDEASLKLTIKPPFWRTIPFYVASVALLMVAVFLFIRLREEKLKRDNQELEAKVQERTREIQRKTEEIQTQNEEILAQAEEINGINENLEMLVKQRTAELERKNKALEEYAFINAHKLRSPVASILGLVNLMKKTPLSEEAKTINTHLQLSANELDEVVSSITKAIERGEK